MVTDPDEHRWLHVALGTVGSFVLLNAFFGTGTLEALLQAPWARPLTWIFLVLGLFVAAFLVEAYRRRRRGGDQWFIEVYAIIGGLFVADAVVEDFLTPLLPPIFEPFLGEVGPWGVALLAVFLLAGLVLAFRRLWNAYWDMGPPAQQN